VRSHPSTGVEAALMKVQLPFKLRIEKTMSANEQLLDRLAIQEGWELNRLQNVELILCGSGIGTIRTLAMAAVSCGFMNLSLVGQKLERLYEVADDVMRHLGPENASFVRVDSPRTFQLKRLSRSKPCVFITDAGDPTNDWLSPADNMLVYWYAEVKGDNGDEFISVGTDRSAVASQRKGRSTGDRAEIPAVCAQLITGVLADLCICEELEPLSPVSRFYLPQLPENSMGLANRAGGILYAGGGGAIAQQEMWAAFLDPVVQTVNCQREIRVVDPKEIHESCRSRQWAYPPESLYKPKTEWTVNWLRHLFPGANVKGVKEKLNKRNFHDGNFDEALASIDNWEGRRVLATLCAEHQIPWWSTGSSFFGGFARRVDVKNRFCASAAEGIERLNDRPVTDSGDTQTSCAAETVPLPSSVLPQMILGSFIACQRRAILLGQADPKTLARGIEAHITHDSRESGFEGLRWSPGRRLNLKMSKRK
jgi:molybdopterin/thiamine biosynthesis adenylyltransferase